MNSKELQYVLKIAEEQSISNAAKKLFISQSTLSHALSKIESSLGAPLFDRSTIPLRLTNTGSLFIAAADKILGLEKELYQQINDIANSKRGTFVIGMTHLAERYYLPMVLPQFHKKYPGIDIVVRVASLASLETMLVKHLIDFAIIIPLDNPQIEFRPIFDMDVLLALPVDHPLSRKHAGSPEEYRELALAELRDDEFIFLQPGRKLRETALEACKAAGFTPNIAIEVTTLDAAHALVAEGFGAAFILDVIKHKAPNTDKVAYFRIKDFSLRQTFCLAYTKNKYLPKAAEEFLRAGR